MIVESIELLRHGKNYLLRTRSTDGVEVITVPNPSRMALTYPIFLQQIVPVFFSTSCSSRRSRRISGRSWNSKAAPLCL